MSNKNLVISKSFFRHKTQKSFISIYIVDYKNVNLLRHYIRFTGKILSRRVTRLTAKEHRLMVSAIFQARRVGLLPFVWLQ